MYRNGNGDGNRNGRRNKHRIARSGRSGRSDSNARSTRNGGIEGCKFGLRHSVSDYSLNISLGLSLYSGQVDVINIINVSITIIPCQLCQYPTGAEIVLLILCLAQRETEWEGYQNPL